jgi:hypothetical protein
MLGPLLLNLLMSAGSPETTLGLDASDQPRPHFRPEQCFKDVSRQPTSKKKNPKGNRRAHRHPAARSC